MPKALVVLLAVPLTLAACSSGGKTVSEQGKTIAPASPAAAASPKTIEVKLTDDGCEPRNIAASAGPTTFKVTSEGGGVTEFEVLDGSTLLGEAEHVAKDKAGGFSLTLKPGSFTTLCPGGAKYDKGTLEVAAAPTAAAANTAQSKAAVGAYLVYVKGEADQLIAATAPFAAAVKAGDVTKAKGAYAAARYHYEAIEPIAESFGDLDPAIDARAGDVPDDQWGGFHRLEKALWADGNATGMAPVADKLEADLVKLRQQINTVELEPAQIANGAVELLNEVSTSKITGEEDRYSHTDLSDFAANLAGSKAAFDALKPLLAGAQQALSDQVEQRFADVKAALDAHRGTDPTGNGFALYTTLTADQTRALSTTVDTLAEPLSKVAAAVLV
jgi:iron uptake system component EfeO